jgi:outer membrane protein assembly factor BamB
VPLRRKVTVVAAVILALAAAGAAAAYFVVFKEPGDISNPDVPFVDATPTPGPKAKKPKQQKPDNFRWPRYGYTKDHNRNFDPEKPIRGPFRAKWKHRASALTEFPPAIAQGRIFQFADDAHLVARDLDTGKKRWERKLGSLSASTPALEDGRVWVTVLETAKGTGKGRVVCLRFRDGKILWSKTLSSRSESSPLLHNGRLFFGTENGTLYALDARSGKQDWTYRAGGAIKGSPTLSDDGVLYFGAYGGTVHAVRARDGKRIWSKSAAGGLRGGNFYATAAVAWGRVYIGATDGRAYSLSAKDGRVAWAHQTGRYVYSSAAVKNVPGRGPMVFFGSYDGVFYALDARSGKVRWTHRTGGRISGGATIIGDTVYTAVLDRDITVGMKVGSGNVAFRYPLGAYDPVISDGVNLYVTGHHSLTALEPRRLYKQRQKAKQAVVRKKKTRAKTLVSPAWPEECRQLAPCGPLTAVRDRRIRMRG